jgi:hypothetical protein
MAGLGRIGKRITLLVCLCVTATIGTGCAQTIPLLPFSLKLFSEMNTMVYAYCRFWRTTPLIPVPAYWSQKIEDTYWEEERYGKVPILDPVEGENAPLFCMDPPSPDEVVRALPDEVSGGIAFVAETRRNNLRMTVELIVDKLEECRFIPLVGPARVHKCHYKCTVYYLKTLSSNWPIPFTHDDHTQEVVYIDKDHLIRCAGPPSNTTP